MNQQTLTDYAKHGSDTLDVLMGRAIANRDFRAMLDAVSVKLDPSEVAIEIAKNTNDIGIWRAYTDNPRFHHPILRKPVFNMKAWLFVVRKRPDFFYYFLNRRNDVSEELVKELLKHLGQNTDAEGLYTFGSSGDSLDREDARIERFAEFVRRAVVARKIELDESDLAPLFETGRWKELNVIYDLAPDSGIPKHAKGVPVMHAVLSANNSFMDNNRVSFGLIAHLAANVPANYKHKTYLGKTALQLAEEQGYVNMVEHMKYHLWV